MVSERRPLPIIRDGHMNGSCNVLVVLSLFLGFLVVLSDVHIASTGRYQQQPCSTTMCIVYWMIVVTNVINSILIEKKT